MNAALITFLVYTIGVFVLAWAANRLLKERDFLSEYFLGSRGLGMWAFALTFAATSASGGSFTGFPALIYAHGWILALWIASYMVVPICQMGLMGKRINQVARKTNAITVPDILRDRFESRLFGLVGTLLIVFFLSFNLVAQFKAGSIILQELLNGVEAYHAGAEWLGGVLPDVSLLQKSDGTPVDSGYMLCLLMFGLAVVLYTTYGGFHAVVWTDVMQGLVMVTGVLIMLPLAVYEVGGLERATRALAALEAETVNEVRLIPSDDLRNAGTIPANTYVAWRDSLSSQLSVWHIVDETPIPTDATSVTVRAIVVPDEQIHQTEWRPPENARLFDGEVLGFGRSETRNYATGPGPDSSSANGFLPLGMAISFFFMWALSGAGQPQYMVRLMAFKNSQTLRRSIITVTIYYSLIYFPLVIIFCCARVLLPDLDQADKVMPRMAVFLTENIGMGWLAGLVVAAPFAAVMSTVDSFLLVISSSVVRDIYQRNLNPSASEKTVKRLSYLSTLIVGTIAVLGAVNPPEYLQDLIVYVGSGLAACFLFPILALLYWPRSNMPGCLAGMLGGFAVHLGMHIVGWFTYGEFVQPYLLLGFSPVVIGVIASLLCLVVVTELTPPPPPHLVQRYFYRGAEG